MGVEEGICFMNKVGRTSSSGFLEEVTFEQDLEIWRRQFYLF